MKIFPSPPFTAKRFTAFQKCLNIAYTPPAMSQRDCKTGAASCVEERETRRVGGCYNKN